MFDTIRFLNEFDPAESASEGFSSVMYLFMMIQILFRLKSHGTKFTAKIFPGSVSPDVTVEDVLEAGAVVTIRAFMVLLILPNKD